MSARDMVDPAVEAAVRAEVAAARRSVVLGDGAQLAAVLVEGPGAPDLLDRVSPRELFIRAGQAVHTLLLDDAGTPVANLYICCGDDDDYLVLAEGLGGAALASRLRAEASDADLDLALVMDMEPSHAVLTLDGPYAWELLADVTTPDVIGLPYLGTFRGDGFTCLRAGETGEYGYQLVVERPALEGLRARFAEAGRRLELVEASTAALDRCRLEAGFFNVRREVRPGLTPVELQLQWRLGAGRAYRGAAAVEARRLAPRGRATLLAGDAPFADDAAVTLDGAPVGTVLHAGFSPTRGDWIGLALLDPAVAHAGLEGFTCAGAPVRTASIPAVNNRSLFVDPQRHSWATRDRDAAPPLVRPRWS